MITRETAEWEKVLKSGNCCDQKISRACGMKKFKRLMRSDNTFIFYYISRLMTVWNVKIFISHHFPLVILEYAQLHASIVITLKIVTFVVAARKGSNYIFLTLWTKMTAQMTMIIISLVPIICGLSTSMVRLFPIGTGHLSPYRQL